MAQPGRLGGSVWLAMAWACAAATVIGFVLPWASVDVKSPGALNTLRKHGAVGDALGELTEQLKRVTVTVHRGAEQVTGELPSLADLPTQIRGFHIPRLANQENSKVALALLDLLMGQQQRIGLKSYAVYLLPGLALLAAGLLTMRPRSRVCGLAVAGACAAVAGVGYWKLLTTNTAALFIAITIGPGLWVTLASYAALAVVAVLQVLVGDRRPAH